jgi:cysteine-rich repeat protein
VTTKSRNSYVHLIVLSSILVMIAVGAQSCDDTATTLCDESGIRCPPGWTCAVRQDVCIEDGCGDGIVDHEAGELCDDGDVSDMGDCRSDCRGWVDCGNGRIEAMEVCDDNNTSSGDGCSSDCQSNETCGNGYRDIDEACDDGNMNSSDGCSTDCKLLTCGNGVRDPGEVCEDGDRTSGDGCSSDCLSNEICGNAYTDVNEDCDDGQHNSNTEPLACRVQCLLPTCGDGIIDSGTRPDGISFAEDCDNGKNGVSVDLPTCDWDCTTRVCGDGYVNVAAGEVCDDGNGSPNDACPSGPSGTCQNARCGDRFVLVGMEQCDDGGDSIGCDADCTVAECGDGYRNQMAQEQCEDDAQCQANKRCLACECEVPVL